MYFFKRIDGDVPPVISIGCGYRDKPGQWDFYSGGEYDELVIWTKSLVRNATLNEIPFFMGGYCKYILQLISNYFQHSFRTDALIDPQN